MRDETLAHGCEGPRAGIPLGLPDYTCLAIAVKTRERVIRMNPASGLC